MSKEKQIEEMARDVTNSIVWDSDGYATVDCLATAKKLHLKGNRKQSEGEWIPSDIPQEKYVCSVCGGACWYYDYQGEVAKSRYCPNCGAKMKGGAE